MISSDEPFREIFIVSGVEELLVRGELFNELTSGDRAMITQINLAKAVALGMANVSRHVQA